MSTKDLATTALAALPAPFPPNPVAPGSSDFWVRERTGVQVHDCTVAPPLVMCMQGRKLVLQVQAGGGTDLSYTARFFSVEKELLPKRRFQFESGEVSCPAVTVGGRSFWPARSTQ